MQFFKLERILSRGVEINISRSYFSNAYLLYHSNKIVSIRYNDDTITIMRRNSFTFCIMGYWGSFGWNDYLNQLLYQFHDTRLCALAQLVYDWDYVDLLYYRQLFCPSAKKMQNVRCFQTTQYCKTNQSRFIIIR